MWGGLSGVGGVCVEKIGGKKGNVKWFLFEERRGEVDGIIIKGRRFWVEG